jgi:hypothetical protein
MSICASSFTATNEEADIGIGREEIPEDINFPDIKAEPLRWYLHLVVVEGLVSSSNPESYAGGSFATSRVSQARQVKRVGTRRREIPRRREL